MCSDGHSGDSSVFILLINFIRSGYRRKTLFFPLALHASNQQSNQIFNGRTRGGQRRPAAWPAKEHRIMATVTETAPAHQPYVSDQTVMPEFTWSAVLVGAFLG